LGRIATLHWYKLPGRLQQERQKLAAIPYFIKSADDIIENRYTVFGDLVFIRRTSLKEERFQIRMEYPSDFPKREQQVFDDAKRFAPGSAGHMFANHGLCLSLPECEEFSVNTNELTSEILGASLVWFHKRLIYERLGKWPGEEYHGIQPRLDILIGRAGLSEALDIQDWIANVLINQKKGREIIDPYSACPCHSSKPLKFCHSEKLKPFFKVMSTIQPEAGEKGR
jgi:hypothetical protein